MDKRNYPLFRKTLKILMVDKKIDGKEAEELKNHLYTISG